MSPLCPGSALFLWCGHVYVSALLPHWVGMASHSLKHILKEDKKFIEVSTIASPLPEEKPQGAWHWASRHVGLHGNKCPACLQQKASRHLVDDGTQFFNLTLDFIALLQQSGP